LPSKQRRSVPIAEPNLRLLLDFSFRADPGDSGPFRRVGVSFRSHFWVVAVGE
jgi:hypothetical protein